MTAATITTHGTYDTLRSAIDEMADQLCLTVGGKFDFSVHVECEDETFQKLVMLVNSLLDASNRALADSQQRESRLRTIVETASDGIVMINARGVVETFNQAAAEMFGYDAEEVVGRNVTMLMPQHHAEQHDTYLANYMSGRGANAVGLRREVEARRKDGTEFPAEIAVGDVEVGDQRMFTAIIRDLSEQKQMQCELTQAQKLESVGQLAAGIAHEINTPTQYVGDNTRFLQDAFRDMSAALAAHEKLLEAVKNKTVNGQNVADVEDVLRKVDIAYLLEEIPQAIEQSLEGVQRVAKIVRAMKEFSHPGSGEKNLVDLAEAIDTTLTVARNEWKYVAEVVTDFDADLPAVPCLPGELNQVILNLVVNAAHAIADAIGDKPSELGTITVSTRRDGDRWAAITVRDTGTGMPEEVRAKIFDPFFTTKKVGEGTGQGLAIARSVIVDKHGGTIECETEVGQGTTFVVRLPLETTQ